MTILDTIAEKTKQRMEEEKRRLSLSELKARVSDMTRDDEEFRFEEALKKQGMSFICEVKKASPSKGLIAPDFPYVDIAKAYESAGADAISVLTEPFYFLGNDSYLREIRKAVATPILRKDFTVDEYMIYQAKEMHADAVLLICSILSRMQLSEYF
ncbi:MAG: indole-3-glycerol-phosphate synthase, partial [Lachnospiraceae bacterium]|nr:indole-3-glycerol-phosphate synthase [Lachnospiraceae bacterium]